MSPDISVITPWLDRPEFIEDYGRAVCADGIEVITIDNGSAKENANALESMTRRLGGKYIRNEENRWFSAANNQGLAQSTGHIVIFLNNDIAGDCSWLLRVKRDVQAGVIYGCSAHQTTIDGKAFGYLEGWCLAAHREMFERLGGWDARAFAMPYFEDIDLCLRAAASGFKLMKVDWPVTHKKNGTSGFVPGVRYAIDRNRQTFIARMRGATMPDPPLRQPADFLVAGRLTEGEAYFRQLLNVEPMRADLWLAYGQILDLSGRFEASEVSLRRALELNPALADAHHALGTLYTQTLRYREAAEEYQRVTHLMPNSAPAFANLAMALRSAGQYESTADAARQALRLDPTNLTAEVELSHALRELGRFGEALVAAETAWKAQPNHADAHYVRGLALQSLNHLDQARGEMERAHELDPHNGNILFCLRLLRARISGAAQLSGQR
ncbi:MAG TPA: tetratricopeptide repeat protein [Tepidisphaeraceae bacterium]|nr:tetratricopeptide repeat protein [Tepidisphaeraceae bacterium]